MSEIEAAYIGMGSNLGDRMDFLKRALDEMARLEQVQVAAVSPVYETEPLGPVEQPDFLNAVVKVYSDLDAREMLRCLQRIEHKLRRKREIRWGPRTIDMDLLFYGDQILDEEDLVVPHPRLSERGFVLAPLCRIAPALVHPVLKRTVSELYGENCPGQGLLCVGELPLP